MAIAASLAPAKMLEEAEVHRGAHKNACARCESTFASRAEPSVCPLCAAVVCGSCRARTVWAVDRKDAVRVCRHCYVEHPRVRHPACLAGPAFPSTFGDWWTMRDAALVLAKEEKEEEACSFSEGGPLEKEEEHDVTTTRDVAVADVKDESALFDKAAPTPTPTPTPTTAKWSTCARCGERVARDVEAIEAHSDRDCANKRLTQVDEADESSEKKSVDVERSRRGGEDAFLGGVRREDAALCPPPRIIYRTATLRGRRSTEEDGTPRVLKHAVGPWFRKREVCSFQDAFRDDRTGTRYVYEISVRHRSVRGKGDHVCAEALLLAHAARPVDGKGDSYSDVTVVSQVDHGQRNSRAPGWLVSPFFKKEPSMLFEEEEEEGGGGSDDAAGGRGEEEYKGVGLGDFELIAVLGRGGFGTVVQVRRRTCGRIFAMKVFRKADLRKRRQVERTKTERLIIQQADHPYVVRLRYAFQTPTKLYLVMDFAQGGDFFSFLRRRRLVLSNDDDNDDNGRMGLMLPEAWVAFYCAEIALALDHLHGLHVVYRDLKSENVLMDSGGHAMLADFGLSRSFADRGPEGAMEATRSYCGTEQYMAPEMLLRRAHTRAVDWWGLGLLAHEMLAGRHPFQGATHASTLRNMVTRDPDLSSDLSKEADSLIRALVAKRVSRRLGTRGGVLELARHPFFFHRKIDWPALAHRQVPAPYVPTVRDDADVAHFDAEFTLQQPLNSEAAKTVAPAEATTFLADLFTLNFNFNNKKKDKPTPTKGPRPPDDDDDDLNSPDHFPNFTYNGAADAS